MFPDAVLFLVIFLLVGVITKGKFVTKNGLTFNVHNDFYYTIYSANIPILQEGAISNIDKMKLLTLLSDNITTIEPGAFQNLPNLYSLGICFNNITRIEVDIFNNLNISTLDLSSNRISYIASHAFDTLKNLENIYLGGNKLEEYDVLWFARAPLLRSVILARNKFKKLPAHAFGIRKTTDYDMIALEGNNISEIDNDAFKGFRKINTLFMNLENVLRGNFLRGIAIDEFDINGRGLHCLPEEIFTKAFVAKKITFYTVKYIDNICEDRIKEWATQHLKTVKINIDSHMSSLGVRVTLELM